jgi:calcineurin-like phosphoesterase family protein
MLSRLSALGVLILCSFGPTASAETFRFTVTADMRDEHEAFNGVARAINTYAGGVGIFHATVGDEDHEIPDNRAVIDANFGASAVWYPIIGNHEAETDRDMVWLREEYNVGHDGRSPLKTFTNQDGPAGSVETTYSWDYGNAHFVAVNEYWNGGTAAGSDTAVDGDVVDALYDWLAADLADNTRPFVFVLGHEPAFPENRHTDDSLNEFPDNRDRFWRLLEEHEVNAYLCGHTHVYSSHRNPGGFTWQIDAGNAGNESSDVEDGSTFLNIEVSDTEVRYDAWRDPRVDGNWRLEESWTQPVNAPPSEEVVLTFEQGREGYSETTDTMLSAYRTTRDYFSAATLELDTANGGHNNMQTEALLRFGELFGDGAGQIPETLEPSDIVSALLILQTTDGGSGASFHRILVDWTDADTWDSLTDGVQADDVEAAAIADALGDGMVDVTASIRAWLGSDDPSEANKGWALLPLGGDGWDFDSAEGAAPPRLIVSFVPEPGMLFLLATGGLAILRRK